MRQTKTAFAKRAILGALHWLGYDLLRLPAHHNDQAYAPVLPVASYSPWNLDPRFLEVYAKIRAATLVDFYKCYELWTLTEQSAKLEGSIIEVGSWRGGSGALIAQHARDCGIHAPVYLCDTFKGVVKAGVNDPVYFGGEHADTSRAAVEALVFDQLKLDNVRILEGIFPDDTGDAVANERFRLCHIDVDVYESARSVVEWIDPRMVVGGFYVYDDYGFPTTPGITKFVDEQRALPDRLVLHNLNGHAIVIRIA
jgi:O-methyltransferase